MSKVVYFYILLLIKNCFQINIEDKEEIGGIIKKEMTTVNQVIKNFETGQLNFTENQTAINRKIEEFNQKMLKIDMQYRDYMKNL